MGLDAILALMPDRTHVELIFLDTESGFGLRELDVSLPELLIAPIGDVRAQQIGALRERGPVVECDVANDLQAQACRTAVRLQRDCEAAGGALVLLEDAADLPVQRSGSSLFFERAIRAASRSSAASMRWLNLSCMAFSLLRRSVERHRITVSHHEPNAGGP